MPTLYETLQSLYEIQQIDTKISRLRRAESALDTGAQAGKASSDARNTANSAVAALHKLQSELKDSELKLKSIEEKRKSYHDRLYQGNITNVKELSNIEKEIGALGRQRSDLDERVLTLMEQVETAQSDSDSAEAAALEAETRSTDVSAAYRSQQEQISLEISAQSRHRAELAELIEDKKLLKRYEDIRAKFGGLGIVKIEDGNCGGCHMSLPSALITAVKDYHAPQTCENCGRLLVT
jgi:predicted  nucleic acid-binding Zn-ribbon protein